MIIIGSSALKYHGIPFREPKDMDIFATDEDLVPLVKGWDVQYIPKHIYDLIPIQDNYATPNAVYTIKISHLPWDQFLNGLHPEIVWEKHKRDILYLEKIGCKVVWPLYKALSKHWKEVNGNKEFLLLKQDKKDFFEDHVTYVYDHDYLHELLSYPRIPIYLSCLEDGQEIDISKEKFDKLSFRQQIQFFRDEIGVIAVERWLVNPTNKGNYNLTQAWNLSLRKTITRLTKGWMSRFIVLHLKHFIKPNKEDFKHIFNTLNIGELNMPKLTNKQIEQLKKDIYSFAVDWQGNPITTEEMDDDEFEDMEHENLYDLLRNSLKVTSPDYQHIEHEGGGEGGAEDCYTVFKWKEKYYKVTYNYYSHHGFDFDYIQWYEVKPKVINRTVYE